MPSPRLADLQEGASLEGFYALQEANLLTTSQGKPYIRMTVRDASAALQGNIWDATQELFNSLRAGGVVKVRAAVESYRGALQLKFTAVRCAKESEYDAADFVPVTPADREALQAELLRLIETVTDEDYAALLHAFFDDADTLAAFAQAPAARQNHHAYVGGLLEHTISIARLAEAFCTASSTRLNRDLLLTGALLHDIGKIQELAITTTIDYTDVGRLIGHLTIGACMVQERAAAIAEFPEEKRWLVMHLILSHHGRLEHGSPVLPAVPEALALHHIDNLDAKTVAARRILDEDAGHERAWTDRSWMLETSLYKTNAERADDSTPTPAAKRKSKKASKNATLF